MLLHLKQTYQNVVTSQNSPNFVIECVFELRFLVWVWVSHR